MTEELTPKARIEKTKQASVMEGSAASMMLGFGEQYIVPFALRLGATVSQIGFLSSGPVLAASLFQLLGAELSEKHSRRKVIIIGAALQALTLLPLFLLPFLTRNTWLLILFYAVYLAFGNVISPAWSSLLGDVIPQGERAEYFARRNRSTIIILFLSILIGGLVLNYFEGENIWIGFGILFFLAFMGRMASAMLFFKHHEPEQQRIIWHDDTFWKFLQELRSSAFGKFVLFRSSISFSVMIAAPFFTVFMLENLQFSYIQFSAVLLVPMIIKAFTMTYWGSLSKRFGNKSIMQASAVLIALIPLSWAVFALLFEGSSFIFWFVLIVELMSGFAWAGMELTTFNHLLDSTTQQRRARLFAYFTVIFGFSIFLGGNLGAFLLKRIAALNINMESIIVLFFISFALRLMVAILLIPRIKDVGSHEKISQGRLFSEFFVQRPLGYAVDTALNTMLIIERRVERQLFTNHSSTQKNDDLPPTKKPAAPAQRKRKPI